MTDTTTFDCRPAHGEALAEASGRLAHGAQTAERGRFVMLDAFVFASVGLLLLLLASLLVIGAL